MTNQELIDAALQELGIVESGDSASATDSATVLSKLNSMMETWGILDMDMNWFPQDTLGDTFPLPRWAEDGVISNLAIFVAPNFRSPVTADLRDKADKGRQVIANYLINHNLEQADVKHLPQGRRSFGDILNGP